MTATDLCPVCGFPTTSFKHSKAEAKGLLGHGGGSNANGALATPLPKPRANAPASSRKRKGKALS